MRRRDERCWRTVRHFDSHERFRIGPDVAQKFDPRRFVDRGCFRLRGRQAFVLRKRQVVDHCDSLIELRGDAADVDERNGFQFIHVARERPPQNRELWAIHSGELAVSELQRCQRGLHIASECKLLTGEHEDLLDFRERKLVARGRKLTIECLQRGLLRLRFSEARVEQRDLGLRVTQFVAEIGFPCLRLRQGGIGVGKPLRDVGAKCLPVAAHVEPCQPTGQCEQQCDDGKHPTRRWRRLGARCSP